MTQPTPRRIVAALDGTTAGREAVRWVEVERRPRAEKHATSQQPARAMAEAP